MRCAFSILVWYKTYWYFSTPSQCVVHSPLKYKTQQDSDFLAPRRNALCILHFSMVQNKTVIFSTCHNVFSTLVWHKTRQWFFFSTPSQCVVHSPLYNRQQSEYPTVIYCALSTYGLHRSNNRQLLQHPVAMRCALFSHDSTEQVFCTSTEGLNQPGANIALWSSKRAMQKQKN